MDTQQRSAKLKAVIAIYPVMECAICTGAAFKETAQPTSPLEAGRPSSTRMDTCMNMWTANAKRNCSTDLSWKRNLDGHSLMTKAFITKTEYEQTTVPKIWSFGLVGSRRVAELKIWLPLLVKSLIGMDEYIGTHLLAHLENGDAK